MPNNIENKVVVKLEDGVWTYTGDPVRAKSDYASLLFESKQKAAFPDDKTQTEQEDENP